MKRVLFAILMCLSVIGLTGCIGKGANDVILKKEVLNSMSENEASSISDDLNIVLGIISIINNMEYTDEQELVDTIGKANIPLDIDHSSSIEYADMKLASANILLSLQHVLTNVQTKTTKEYRRDIEENLIILMNRCNDDRETLNKFIISDDAWDYYVEISGW